MASLKSASSVLVTSCIVIAPSCRREPATADRATDARGARAAPVDAAALSRLKAAADASRYAAAPSALASPHAPLATDQQWVRELFPRGDIAVPAAFGRVRIGIPVAEAEREIPASLFVASRLGPDGMRVGEYAELTWGGSAQHGEQMRVTYLDARPRQA